MPPLMMSTLFSSANEHTVAALFVFVWAPIYVLVSLARGFFPGLQIEKQRRLNQNHLRNSVWFAAGNAGFAIWNGGKTVLVNL